MQKSKDCFQNVNIKIIYDTVCEAGLGQTTFESYVL